MNVTVRLAEFESGRVDDLIARARALIFDVDGTLASAFPSQAEISLSYFLPADRVVRGNNIGVGPSASILRGLL